MAGSDGRSGESTKKSTTVWTIAVIATVPGLLLAEAVLKELYDNNVFTTPPLVYDVLDVALVVIIAPALALIGWRYLIRRSDLRSHWEMRLLVVCVAILLPVAGAVVTLNLLFDILWLPASVLHIFGVFLVALWFPLAGVCALTMLSLMVAIIRQEFGESSW